MKIQTNTCRLMAAVLLLLIAVNVQARVLNVYTYSSFTTGWGPGPALKELFEAQCDCEVNFTSSDDGVSLLNRLRLEGGSTRADVIVGLDDLLMPQARRLGLVQPHGFTLSDWPLRESLDWQDSHFIPFDFGYFAFIYDSHKVAEPATSLEALINSGASIIYQDPRTSTPGQGLMHWMQVVYADEAAEAWQRLAANTVTVTKGWSEAYGMFLQGEADYVLSYSTSPAYHQLIEETDTYQASRFEEGHTAQVEVAAVSAYSREPELGQAFLAFLLSKEAQTLLPETNWMLPVRSDIDLPAAFADAEREVIGFSPDEVDAQRREWISIWRNAVSR